jgi:hypothetical protein
VDPKQLEAALAGGGQSQIDANLVSEPAETPGHRGSGWPDDSDLGGNDGGTPAAAVAGQAGELPVEGTASQLEDDAVETQLAGARAIAAKMGLAQAGNFQDDEALMGALLQRAGHASQYEARIAELERQNQYAQQLYAQQQQPQNVVPAAVPAGPKRVRLVELPEYDARWEQMVTKGEDGTLKVVAGADPTILPKYTAYHNARRDFVERLTSRPDEVLQPFVEAAAEEKARALVKAEFESREKEAFVQNFARQHAEWLYEKNPLTQEPLVDGRGNRVLTAEGRQMQYRLAEAEQMGIPTLHAQEAYARAMLKADIEAYQAQMGLANPQRQQARATVLAANRRANRSGAQPRFNGQEPVGKPTGSFREMLTAAMAQGGMDEQSLVAGLGG